MNSWVILDEKILMVVSVARLQLVQSGDGVQQDLRCSNSSPDIQFALSIGLRRSCRQIGRQDNDRVMPQFFQAVRSLQPLHGEFLSGC